MIACSVCENTYNDRAKGRQFFEKLILFINSLMLLLLGVGVLCLVLVLSVFLCVLTSLTIFLLRKCFTLVVLWLSLFCVSSLVCCL